MLCNRIKQFREYNKLKESTLADYLGISVDTYCDYESGRRQPDIDTVTKLAQCYKVTVDEFYGYIPRLALHSDEDILSEDDEVKPETLKMSDLSWDEVQLILYYRTAAPDDELIKKIIQRNEENKQ
ncbi:MAG: helix-turn-helix transcriptional regulator [Clostridia bacterium]|nr:helix-turn-helix transcriptional regulator [Clostridia bacterium]